MLVVKIYSVGFLFVLAARGSFQNSVDYRGKEFVLSFSPQHPRYLFSGNNILYISSFENGTVRVHVPSLTNIPEKSYALSAGGLTIVQLSSNTRTNGTSGLKKKKGIRITADKPMSVQGLANATQRMEGFLGLPVDALGMFYIAAAYHPVINAVIQVVAIEDNTTVTITLRTNGKVQYQDNWYGNGHIISETLNDLDVFQVLAEQDLTGTIIRSSKPVAVFTGDDCTLVPVNKPPCNHLVEQIPPVSLWGKIFVTNPTPNSPGGDEFHIIASQNTAVYVDSQYKVTLDQGEKYKIDVSWNKSSVISTTQPSLVMQYSKAGKSPSMNLVPPMQSFTNDYTVYVPQDEQGNTFDCYVNVIIDTASRSGLRVKGADSVVKNWTPILGSGGFSRASIHLTSVGSYHVYHENPLSTFSAVFYGMNRNGMLFAMPAGMELPRQTLDDTCKPTNTVGGDNIDNDCDGLTDEELKNGVDDDSDGVVDEDLATPVPTLTTPKNFVTTLCNRSSDVFNAGTASGSAYGACLARGEAKISHMDNIVTNNTCGRITDRVWNITDSCGNSVTGIQRVTVYTPEEPTIALPKDIVFTCREKKYLDPKFAGQVTVTNTNLCPRNVTITYVDRYKDDCLNSNREGRLERIWTVKDKCKGSQTKSQVIILVPKGLRRSASYVVSFKLTNEMFSAELQDMESPAFKSLSRGLELELEKTFMESKSILGQFFVAATVLDFSNGSVIPRVLIKIDAQSQISQWQLVEFMNETLKSGMLGKYQVDPTSVELTDFDECQAPDLNNCHKKAKCTNTVGSYNCSCLKGFIGDGVLCRDSVDYRGKEFVLSFSPQHPSYLFSGNNILYISSFENGTVRVHVPSLTNFPEKSYALSAGGLTIVQLSGNTHTNGTSGLKKKKGIRITADKPMSVQGLANATQTVEGFLGLPVDALGMFYIAAAYHPVINAVIQVVAIEDNTTVTITLRTNGKVQYQDNWYGNGHIISETLNDLDVFQVLADQDLTGTIIRSTKPVAVFTGDDCTMVPENKPPCNHLVEQIPPVFLWGKVFVTNPTPNSPGGDEFHIIASQNTEVKVDSQYKVTLDQGEKYKMDVSWNKSSMISTTQPSLVMQYSKAGKSPSMSVVPPMQSFTNDYTVYVPQDDQGNTFDCYVNVIIDTASRSGLRVKGAGSIVKNWTTILGSGGFSRASIHLTSVGSHHVYHENPLTTFSAVFYGTNRNGMLFAMPAGMELQLQSLDDTCKPTNTVGGDNIDNDCDGLTDEELKNGVDDDSDGRVDEDLVTPVPTLTTPKHFVTTLCNRSSDVFNAGTARGSAHGVCKARGEAKISHMDNVVSNNTCGRITDRVWNITDSCGNSVAGIQRVAVYTPEEPTIVFPKDIVFTCREKKYLDPKFAGQVTVTSTNLCPRNVTITYIDRYKDDCLNSNREGRLERIWTVKDKCKGSQTKTQVIILVPKGLRRSANYVVSFKITNEMFSAELQDMESPSFTSLSRGLELELEKTFMESKSILGQFFLAATVLNFSNGSVIPRVLIKIDAQTQISQWQLLEFMNENLKSGMLGKYQLDPSSVELTDFDECQAPDLNNCHKKAKCTNTVGSYNCSCLKGFIGDGVLCRDSVDYRGKEFVLSFSPQHPSYLFSGNNILYISSFENGTVRVHVPSLTNSPEKSYALSAGVVTIVQLSSNTRTNSTSGLKKKKGIRITADKPMSVQGLANATQTVEGFLGLPVDALGMFYIAAAYQPVINAVIQVVAIEDNTTVTITLRTNGKVQYQDNWYGNGHIISETLNDLDVFQVLADQDLTGTIIRSTKPVAVFTGDDCTMVPENKPPCNHLVEQIPPVFLWGKVFVTNPTPNSPGGDEFHIIASQNTEVKVDSQYKVTLDQGEKYKIDVSWNKSSVISTTQPSLVMQYSKAGKSPSVNVVPPMESFTNDYTVYVPQDDQGITFDCYVNVVIDTASRSGLHVKGAGSIVKNWTTILGSGGFSRASIHLTSVGSHHVYHENPLTTFSAVFYGTNRNGMLFAMPAGMELQLQSLQLQRQSPDDTCKPTKTVGGDNIDNDCDGLTDEELKNGVDDDSDGRVDEDLVTPVPTLTTPKHFVTTLCNRSSDVFNAGTARGSAHGVCKARGEAKISHIDNIVSNNTCGRITDRVWNITDSCGNSVTGIQRVTVYTPEEPTIVFPKDIVFTCREKKYLDPKFAGQVTVTSTNLCPRNVTITYVDRYKDDCLNSNREGRLERIWTVKDKCKGSQTKSQVIILVPKGLRRSANYVVLFKITNEMFSAELQDMESPSFKSLSRGLELELEKTFMESKSILGQFFVAATVLNFSNGSVIPRVLIKIDAQAQISQWQLVEFMNETLKSSMLGKYQVDPTSVELTDFDECQAPDLNNCHKKAKCTNTVGSYNCSCLKGFIGDGVLCQDSVDYRGKEFVLSFSPQHPRHPFSGNNILYISSFEDGTVRVHVPSLTNFPEKSYALSAGGLTIVQLSGNTRTNGNSGLEKKKGIRITADKPMSVQGLANATQKVEGFLGLPVDALGMFYIAAAYHPVINAVIQVVATEDNTTVTIKLRTSGRVQYQDNWYGDGQVISETLNDLDVFQVLADQDLTGTIIRSTKPVAVFTGDDCTMVPENKQPCNHLVEQIPPVSLWGKVFVTNPTPNSPGGDEFHIIASQNTAVYVDSQYKVTLDQGEKYKIDVSWNKSSVISTTQPSLVIQYSKAGKSPSMNVVPPMQYFTNDYTVYVPQDDQGNTFDCYVNVVIDTASRSGLRVKGADSIVKNWTVIPGSGGFSRASIHLTSDGSYHVYHENPLTTFSAVFYGTNRNGMLFAMPAGMELQLQSLDDTCKPTNTVGGDNIDNDCDGLTDEELKNGVDDDSDGRVDEDLVTPVPTLTTPKHFVTTLCNRSSGVSNTGTASGSAHGVCRARGEAKISHKDNIVKNNACGRITDRVWIITDSCGNFVTGIQRLTVYTPEEPTIVFPKDIVFTCREKKYLDPKFAGQVSLTSAKKLCPRNVTITYVDRYKDDCLNSNREGRLERRWTVKDKCKGSQTKSQVIILVPKGLRRSTNYVVSFKITNEMFSAELQDMESPTFKSLSRGLELELEKTFMGSKSILGQFFVAATVLDFSNGSVIPRVLIKIDAQTQISQRQLVEFMNETLKSGMLGKYQADPTSIESTDFDECQAPDLNNCHEKAKCINTVGSYNCSCLKGFVGDGVLCQAPPSISYIDPAMEIGTEENVTLACHAEGLPEPNITWVTPDEQLVTAASDILETSTLDDDSKYVRGKKMQQDGSLLIYNTRDNDGGIYKCIAENGVGRDVKSVNVTVRDDLVGVDAAITIEDQVFDQDLENKSSTRYQTLEQQVKQELTALFQDIEGFEEVIILGFVNGSVKVRFRVVVIVKPEEKKTTVVANKVGKTLSASVQTGQIGSLKVKKKVELRELPPPPENVRASDVERTEAVITWSHPELYQMYSINGYSLQIRQFGTNTWLHFTSTPGENHRITNLDPDTAYFVRLKSKNEYGMGEPSTNGELKTKKEKNVAELVLPIVISLLLIIILAIVVVIVYRRWKKKRQNSGNLNDGEQVPMNPVTLDTQNHSETENGRFTTSTFGRDRYALVPGGEPNIASTPIDIQASFSWREIPRDRIILGKILGEGEFGTVVKGELTEDDGNVITCAVKKLKRTATESDLKDLLNELEIMTSVGNHPNLVNLIGACSVAGPLLVVVEFAEHGNLLRHLRDRRKQNYDDMNEYTLEISFTERLRIACEVSDGMKHLAAMKCAHRDLAARNVLLGEGMVAKVSDFGLSRDIYTDNVYEKKTGGKLPAKWMAVESLEQGIYTSQSDVWSFGVLLWEIETGGCAPYAGVASSELLPKLKAGHRLDKPRYCTDWLYAIMLRCWNANPKARPKFEDLSDELHRMLNQQSDYLTPEDYKGESSYLNTSRENISA